MPKCGKCGNEMPYSGICLQCTTKVGGTKIIIRAKDMKDVRSVLALNKSIIVPGTTNVEVIKVPPKFVIAVDIDGVFLDIEKAWMKAYTRKTGKPAFEINEWHFGDKMGMSREEVTQLFNEIKPEDVTLIDKNAPEIIRKMNTFAHVFFLTDKTPEMLDWTMPIIEKLMPDIPVVVEKEKWKCSFDLLIDDCPQTVKECSDNNKNVIMFWRNYNQEADHNDVAVTWNDILHRSLEYFREWLVTS